MDFRPDDLRIDAFRSSGPGAVSHAAVRITHLPTGTVVVAVSEDTAAGNKRRAMARMEEFLSAGPGQPG